MPSSSNRGSAAWEQGSQGSDALERLKRGELTLEAYIDERVDGALERLGRLVPDEQREMLREVLREQALVDPSIQEYLRLATGRAMTGPE